MPRQLVQGRKLHSHQPLFLSPGVIHTRSKHVCTRTFQNNDFHLNRLLLQCRSTDGDHKAFCYAAEGVSEPATSYTEWAVAQEIYPRPGKVGQCEWRRQVSVHAGPSIEHGRLRTIQDLHWSSEAANWLCDPDPRHRQRHGEEWYSLYADLPEFDAQYSSTVSGKPTNLRILPLVD